MVTPHLFMGTMSATPTPAATPAPYSLNPSATGTAVDLLEARVDGVNADGGDKAQQRPPSSSSSTAIEQQQVEATKPEVEAGAEAPTPNAVFPPPPDGGAHAWMTVAGCFLGVFVQFGLANSFGVFQEYYESHQLAGYSASTISWIGGIQQFLLFFGGLFIGRVFDAHGAHVLIVPGSLCIVTSLMLTSRKSRLVIATVAR